MPKNILFWVLVAALVSLLLIPASAQLASSTQDISESFGNLASTTEDNRVIIITPEPDPEPIVKPIKMPGSVRIIQQPSLVDVAVVEEKYDAVAVFDNTLLYDTPECADYCRSDVPWHNPEDVKWDNLKVHFFHDDKTFQQPFDDAMKVYSMALWDGSKWVAPSVETVIPAGDYRLALQGFKNQNVDVAWILETKYDGGGLYDVRVDSLQYSIWKKGAESNSSNTRVLYHMNDAGATLVDSANGYSLTCYNSTTFSQVGIFNNAVKFDGVNDVCMAAATSAQLQAVRTKESWGAWFKSGSVNGGGAGNDAYIMQAVFNKYRFNMQVMRDSITNKLNCRVDNATGAALVRSTYSVADNLWHNAWCTLNGTALNMYIDGKLNATAGWSGAVQDESATAASRFRIGCGDLACGAGGALSSFNGTIDEVIVLNYSITDADALNYYEAAITQLNITTASGQTFSSAFSFNTTIGLNGDFGNATVRHYNGTTDVITTAANSSSVQLFNVNATHYVLKVSYGSIPNGNYNTSVSACNSGLALITCDTGVFNFSESNTYVSNYLPLDSSVYGSLSINHQCLFANDNLTAVRDVFINSWGSSFTYFANTSDASAGAKQFDIAYPDNGAYVWGCGFDWANGTRVFATNGNFSLNISGVSTNPIVGGGNCQTNTAYYFAYTAAALENRIMVNLTALRSEGYLFDTNASNVWVDGGVSYNVPGDKSSIYVDTSLVKPFVVYIGSFGRTVNRTSDATSADRILYLGISNFTQIAPAYVVNVLDETSGSAWSYSNSAAQTLDIYCMTYAVERLDLKAWNRTKLFIGTKEVPYIFHGINNGTGTGSIVNRKIMPSSSLETVNLYFLPPSYQTCDFNFALADYTGDFQYPNSYLTIQTNVNNTIQTMWKERWSGLYVNNVQLQANDYYKTQVTSGTNMRDISWFIAACNATQITLTITTPAIPAPTDFYSGATLGFTGDYASGQLGFAYNITNDTVGAAAFTVQLQNDSGLYHVYSSSISGYSAGSFSTIVPAVNTTYLVKGEVNSTKYGTMKIQGVYSLFNNTARYIAFPSLPQTVLGESQQTLFNGISMMALVFGAFMFGAFYSGFGGLFVSFGGTLLYWLGFLDVPWAILAFINVLAVMNFWTAERGR